MLCNESHPGISWQLDTKALFHVHYSILFTLVFHGNCEKRDMLTPCSQAFHTFMTQVVVILKSYGVITYTINLWIKTNDKGKINFPLNFIFSKALTVKTFFFFYKKKTRCLQPKVFLNQGQSH